MRMSEKPQRQTSTSESRRHFRARLLDRLSTTQYESTVALLDRDRKIRSHRTEDYV
jgi:hypothetical protein